LSHVKIKGPGQVPIPFKMEYDPASIDERMTYAVRATISDRGRLMFTSDTVVPVLTRDAGNDVELVLVRARDKPSAGMELKGMFQYMADAALFRDCRDGKTYPVAMEGQYPELEVAYLNSGIEAGTEVMVTLHGRLLTRPSMEGNSSEINLIVDTFNKLSPDETCAPTTHADLINTYWRLDELNGRKVTTPENMKEAHMVLSSDESGPGVSGFGGCNRFFGQFQTDGDALSFSAMGSTMMACPAGMDTERDFMAALGATTRYAISGLFLELYADDQLLARLEAVYL
jgi:heat shock protein HslJ